MKYKNVNDDTSELLNRFIRYKRVIQGRSEKTVSEYALDLRTFFRYIISKRQKTGLSNEELETVSIECVNEDFIKSVTTLDIFEFLEFAADERKNTAVTRSRKLSAIKAFFKYVTVNEHIIKENPAANIESPKKKQSLPKYLSRDESVDLLESVLSDEESKTKERDYCIIALFLNCGMRLSELVGINLTDIDSHFRSLRVVGKGNKERIVYLNDACGEALALYLDVRAKIMNLKDKNALFISRLGKRINNKTVQWVVGKYLNAAGLGYKHYSTHKLRHTAATLMYQEGGADVLALKEILGHAQLNTTQIYTHVNNRKLQEAVGNHPLAGISEKKLKNKVLREKEEAEEARKDADDEEDE